MASSTERAPRPTGRRSTGLGIALAAFLLAGTTACGGGSGSITLTADKMSAPADGRSAFLLTAEVKFRGSAASGSVEFSVDPPLGSSFGSAGRDETRESESLRSGRATVMLFTGFEAGTPTVTASWTNPNGDTIEALLDIEFELPPPAAADKFEFECDHRNLGVGYASDDEPQTLCTVRARQRDNQPVVNPKVTFLLEAGAFDAEPEERNDADGSQVFRYRAIGNWPADVDPLPGTEPSRINAGLTRNPRDGLVSVVAVIRGAEPFTDLNGNGVYDESDDFEDLGEPFVDCNDDGRWNSGDPCEADSSRYIDLNDNGQPDGPNGRWDGDTQVWRSFKLLWTTPPEKGSEASRMEEDITKSPAINLRDGGEQVFNIFFVDENLNPPAATNFRSDSIRISSSGVQLQSSNSESIGRSIGMEFDDGLKGEHAFLGDGEVLRVTDVDTVGSCLETGVRCFQAIIADPRPGDIEDPPKAAELEITIRYTPIPSGNTETYEDIATGTFE